MTRAGIAPAAPALAAIAAAAAALLAVGAQLRAGGGDRLCVIAAALAALLAAAPARPAEAATEDTLERARAVYQEALDEQDRIRRTRLFGEAERLFSMLAAERPDAPEVLADWGNAALGAQHLGQAVLAYRRALQVAPTHERAQRNLDWLRDRAPVWLPRPSEDSPLDSLLFWQDRLSVAQRYVIGAAAFAVALLLLAPWSLRRGRALRRLAAPALLVWAAATASAVLAADDAGAAVVVADGSVLRSADSLGAPAALANPLPAGAEVQILERRDGWTRITLADGTRGWVAASAVVPVSPE